MAIKEIKEKFQVVKATISVIHAALFKRNIELVKYITKNASLEDILKLKMICDDPHPWKFNSRCSWILDATIIHLAACLHAESLALFIEIDPTQHEVTGDFSEKGQRLLSKLTLNKMNTIQSYATAGTTLEWTGMRCHFFQN